MATKGLILENKTTGDTYEFLETSKETKGEYLKVKTTLVGKGKVVLDHIHISQDEVFEVLEGELTIVAKGATNVIRAGGKATLPKGEAHNHYNEADVPVTFIQTITPALKFAMNTIAPLARVFGYRASYKKYAGVEK